MKNLCNNCGKCSNALDDFGYCPKCSKKLFGLSKHTTVEQIKIKNNIKKCSICFIILICIGISVYYRNDILDFISISSETSSDNISSSSTQSSSHIEDEILTADNYQLLSEEYSNIDPESDNLYYYSYACMYYIITDGLSAVMLSEQEQQEVMYSRIYGKTINQLISEGKKLMKENNITLDEYKKTCNDSTSY